jgi:hypothetical protein
MMHSHDWKPIREGRVPIIGVPYTLMKCECGETYPVVHDKEVS